MLVLTREVDERIRIGDDIEILVVRIRDDAVRLGITAPDHLRIMRAELLDRDQNRDANATKADAMERQPTNRDAARHGRSGRQRRTPRRP